MIRSLDQMVEKVLSLHKKHRIAVAWPQDIHTISAIHKAVNYGLADALLIGQSTEIISICRRAGIDNEIFTIIDSEDEVKASAEAVRLTRSGEADITMKGLVGTDKFLKAVMDKSNGLMLPDSVLSYVCALELPAYHKLLFITDPAVIPSTSLEQKIIMAKYAAEMAGKFGVNKPKIALISASEKPSRHFKSSDDYKAMCSMAEKGQFANCIMDGPLDIFLACDKKSVVIKGINTPVNGDAD
ncbi:MAG: phosphate acetyltransferase, partial [Bacteroidia bacterium]